MATKFSKSKASADNANRGLYKKGGSTMKKYKYAGEVEPKPTGDTIRGRTVRVTKITGNKGNPQGAPKADTTTKKK